jgi:hypothetical protein
MCSWKRECKDNLGGSLQLDEEHFGMEKIVVILKKHFYWPKLRRDVNKYMISFTACAIAKPSIKKKGAYTPIFLLLRGLGNPSLWITWMAFCPQRKEMIAYLWWLLSF